MSKCSQLWVDRTQLKTTRIVTSEPPSPVDGDILVAIDKFGLTANNVSYAVSGDVIGYWSYFPAESNWGIVPVWGCANVIISNSPDIPVGERIFGFFPMASHAILRPGHIRDEQFTDIKPHRAELPALYNGYRRTKAEPDFLQSMEVERCLLFPLFITSWLIYDYLVDNAFFGAEQILIGSVSSKTGFALAKLLREDPEIAQRIVGLTSPANVPFVENLNCCDEIVTYGNEATIDATMPAAYVDMSGDARLTTTLHMLLGDNMRESAMVGATHWEQRGATGKLPGARPTFFFAPAQIAKRDAQWGSGATIVKAMAASAKIAQLIRDELHVEWTTDAEALAKLWVELLENRVAPNRGLMVAL